MKAESGKKRPGAAGFGSLLDAWEKDHSVPDKDAVPAGGESRKRKPSSAEKVFVLDLHGRIGKEAVGDLELLFLSGKTRLSGEIRIIHGVGRHSPEGRKVLKPLVREWLKLHADLFGEIRPGRTGEGGPGVTVVRMRRG